LIYKNFGALEKAERVENFYGFSKISGKSLVEKGLRQARKMGAKTIQCEVVGISSEEISSEDISSEEDIFTVKTADSSYECKTVLLATGANRDVPSISGIDELEGSGISYCAICDGFFYRGKDVAVLGDGAYALNEVMDLLPLASSVTVLTNGREPTAIFPDEVKIINAKICKITSRPLAIGGAAVLSKSPREVFSGIIFENGAELPFSGLFIAQGIAGGTLLAKKIGALISPQNSIITESDMRTSIRGLWAAGDCVGGFKQIVKASHDGFVAGMSIINFLREIE